MSDLRRLFIRPCRACGERVGRPAHLCESCIDHLPVERCWQFRDAYDSRRRDRTGYRVALARSANWLAANPKRPGAATTTKEKP